MSTQTAKGCRKNDNLFYIKGAIGNLKIVKSATADIVGYPLTTPDVYYASGVAVVKILINLFYRMLADEKYT